MPEVTSLSPASSNKNTGTAGVAEILQKVTGLVFGPAGEVIALADRADARTFIPGETTRGQ
jgi:type IV secretory pathway VirB2 component (pilin)